MDVAVDDARQEVLAVEVDGSVGGTDVVGRADGRYLPVRDADGDVGLDTVGCDDCPVVESGVESHAGSLRPVKM